MRSGVYKTITLVLFATSVAGCAGLRPSAESESMDMLATYQKMSDELDGEPSFATYEQYLSRELIDQIRSDFPDNLDQQVEFLAPPFWFRSVDDTYQGSAGERQCLAVNGVSVDGDPISAAMEYVDRRDRLKIRAVEIALYEPGDDLPGEVWCPVRLDEL